MRALSWPGVVWLGLATATEGGGRVPARRCTALGLTKLGQRVREEAVGRWGTSGGVAGVEKQRGRVGVGYGDGGGAGRARLSLRRGRRSRNWEKRRGVARAGAGGDEGAPRRVVACTDRALATRGRRRGHAARGFCRCRPLNVAIQLIQSRDAVPDDVLSWSLIF